MSRTLGLLMAGLLALSQNAAMAYPMTPIPERADLLPSDRITKAAGFNCQRTTCKQIRSCEEACYKLKVCGHKQRDGDGDGIPCENLCKRRC